MKTLSAKLLATTMSLSMLGGIATSANAFNWFGSNDSSTTTTSYSQMAQPDDSNRPNLCTTADQDDCVDPSTMPKPENMGDDENRPQPPQGSSDSDRPEPPQGSSDSDRPQPPQGNASNMGFQQQGNDENRPNLCTTADQDDCVDPSTMPRPEMPSNNSN